MKTEIDDNRLLEVGKYLTQVREAHGLTQREAAEKAGMESPGYLSLIENGKRAVSLKTLDKLSRAYIDVGFERMAAAIGFGKNGKLLPSKGFIPKPPMMAEESSGADEKQDAVTDADALAKLLEAALEFMGRDPNYLPPEFPAETMRDKVRDLSAYQKKTGRRLLTLLEMQMLIVGAFTKSTVP